MPPALLLLQPLLSCSSSLCDRFCRYLHHGAVFTRQLCSYGPERHTLNPVTQITIAVMACAGDRAQDQSTDHSFITRRSLWNILGLLLLTAAVPASSPPAVALNPLLMSKS